MRKKLQRTSIQGLCLTGLLVLASMVGYKHWLNQANVVADHIAVSINAAPRTLDPRFATDAISFRLAQLLYPAPVRFDASGTPVAWATQWQMLSPQHFRLQLTPAYQHLDIDDLIATYQSVLHKDLGSPHRGSLEHIQEIIRIDDNSADFILNKPDTLFPGTLVIGIIPRQAIGKLDNQQLTHSQGAGFFQLLHWQGGDIRMRRKHDGQTFLFKVSKDPTIQTLQMLSQEVDLVPFGLTPELSSYLANKNHLSIAQTNGSTYAYIGLNLADEVLKQVDIRQAIALSIDRQAIIDNLLQGRARLATSLMPPSHWSSAKDLQQYQPNLAKAKQLLAKHGYDAQRPLHLSFKSSKNAFRLRIAALLQQQLQAANIHIHIQSYDWGTFYGDIKAGRFQLYTLAWVGIKQPDIYRYVFHSDMLPPKGANRNRFVNTEVDAYIDAANNAVERNHKALAYQRLQRIVHQQLPYIPLWYEDQYALINQRLSNFQIGSDGNLLSLNEVILNDKPQ